MSNDGTGLRERLLAAADKAMDSGYETADSRLLREAAAALSAVAPPGMTLIGEAQIRAENEALTGCTWFRSAIPPGTPIYAASPAAPAQPEGGDALVEFFRGEGQRFGLEGDARGWTPEQTAIEVMRRHMAKPAAEADPSDSRLPWKDPRDFANDGNPTRCAAIWNEAVAETSAALTRPAPAQQDEMKELLHSTHEIALRGGADTDWEALAKSIAKLGISPITARHYFAEGTPRETINKHLDALLSRVNAARRAALTSTAAASAADAQEGK